MPTNRAYVMRLRTDVPAAAIQWLDLKPNTSQRNLVYEKTPQTGYLLGRPENDTLAALVANETVADYSGLAAYLIDNVIDSGGATITVTVANATAVDLIADMDAGNTLGLTDINAQLVANGATAGTELDTGGSTGSVDDVLKILSGGAYNLPEGSLVGGLAAGAQLGSFDDDAYRQLYVSGALQMSCGEGDLAAFAASTFEYDGTAGSALIVYQSDGTVLT